MINKKIASELAVGIILFLAFLVGAVFWKQSRESSIQSSENKEPLSYQQSFIDNQSKKVTIKSLCEKAKGGRIVKCGQYYKKFPPKGTYDLPSEIYDNSFILEDKCGGLTSEVKLKSQLCNLACEDNDLCAGL